MTNKANNADHLLTSAHTPGPWAVNPFRAQIDSAQVFGDGDLIPVAQLLWPTSLRGEEETWANARLIAAAPALLANSEALVSSLEEIRFTSCNAALAILKATIASAKGEA